MKLTTKKIEDFQNTVYLYYGQQGRDLPWRKTDNPYHILVSEVMLQQTQVDRVKEKYITFLSAFPTVQSLASSSLKDVLRVWQGLGYNRRAKYVREAAQLITHKYGGNIPSSIEELEELPGIGPATARSIAAFAFNTPVAFIETNVRSVFLHHFFSGKSGVSDAELLPYVEQTLDKKNPRLWYNALMDYGVHIKKLHKNPSRRSTHHVRQKPFKGSNREVRGAMLRLLSEQTTTKRKLQKELKIEAGRMMKLLEDLEAEGFVSIQNSHVSLV